MKLPANFCVLPFLSFNMEVAGALRPCCENLGSFGSGRGDDIMTAWNGEDWRELRRSFVLDERHPSCSYCWQLEDAGVTSYRALNNAWHEPLLRELAEDEYDFTTGEMLVPPKIVVFKLSNLCNLACRMCIPSVSTSVMKFWDADLERLTGDSHAGVQKNYENLDALRAELRYMAPHLSQISFSGGEPFADPKVLAVLKELQPWAAGIRVYINTNLSKLQHGGIDVLGLLDGYAQKMICVSIDGPPALHAYTRPGLDIERFLANLRRLQDDPTITLHTNTALYALNAQYFADTLEWILSEVRPQRLNVSLSTKAGSEHMDARVLPGPLKAAATARLQALRARLPGEGAPDDCELMHDVRACLDTVTGFLAAQDLCTPAHLSRLASYFRRLDRIHGTRLHDVNPSVAALIETVPDFEGVAILRQGPVAGMPVDPSTTPAGP
jgi:pyruvate-formate lyase-activating enzyme